MGYDDEAYIREIIKDMQRETADYEKALREWQQELEKSNANLKRINNCIFIFACLIWIFDLYLFFLV
jgi:septal ring factor EnvC (AmiA/AmiB activator)